MKPRVTPLPDPLHSATPQRRRAKIVCTVGPASQTEEMIQELMLRGMNVARLNFSHGTHADQARVIRRLRKGAESWDAPSASCKTFRAQRFALDGSRASPRSTEHGPDRHHHAERCIRHRCADSNNLSGSRERCKTGGTHPAVGRAS